MDKTSPHCCRNREAKAGLRMIWNRGLILLLVGALAGVKCSEEDFGVYHSPNGIRVVTGPIQEKESDSTEDVYLPSWRHHVDFDVRLRKVE